MAKTEEIPASNDATLLSLISSLQGLTLTLQANMPGTTAQQAKPPPATAAAVSTSNTVPAVAPTTTQATTAPVAPAATAPVAPAVTAPVAPAATVPVAPAVTAPVAPAVATPAPPAVATPPTNSTPTVATGSVPPTPPGPNPPPVAIGTLAAVYLTPLAHSSQGVHPTVLEALPNIVNAPESGPWFVVTVGRYTGVYSEWSEVSPIVSSWSGVCYKWYSTKSAALASYDHAWIRGLVHGGIHPDHHL